MKSCCLCHCSGDTETAGGPTTGLIMPSCTQCYQLPPTFFSATSKKNLPAEKFVWAQNQNFVTYIRYTILSLLSRSLYFHKWSKLTRKRRKYDKFIQFLKETSLQRVRPPFVFFLGQSWRQNCPTDHIFKRLILSYAAEFSASCNAACTPHRHGGPVQALQSPAGVSGQLCLTRQERRPRQWEEGGV